MAFLAKRVDDKRVLPKDSLISGAEVMAERQKKPQKPLLPGNVKLPLELRFQTS
jgi:hypothetical protein